MFKGMLVSSIALAAGISSPAWAQSTANNPDGAPQSTVKKPGDKPAPVQPAQSSDIVVTGIRSSLESAQSIKRNSDAIVDSIVAEDIDKLPDITVAESTAHLPGVQVDRSQGEASSVRIRGLPNITTTYNGLEIFTGKGRNVALQDFPAGSIKRIDVYKSATASLVGPGIAGLIDVQSRRPLDFRKDQLFGSVSGVHWYQSQRLGFDANLLISKRWDTSIGQIGILVSGSYTQNNYINAVRVNNLTIVHRANPDIYYPQSVNTNYDQADRWRPSANFALQWKPSSNLELHIDGLFQGYRSNGANVQLRSQAGAQATISNVVLFPGTNLVKSMDVSKGAFPAGTTQTIQGHTDTYMIDGGFKWRRGPLKLSGAVAYNDSTFESRNFLLNFTLTGMPYEHFDYDTDVGAGGGTVVLSNYDLTDPQNYRLTSVTDARQKATGREVQARFDAEYDLSGAILDKLQAGIRYSDRHAQSFVYNQKSNAPAQTYFTDLPFDYTTTSPGFRNDKATSLQVFLVPTRDSVLANLDYLRNLTGIPEPSYGDPTYQSDEKTYAGYAQARYSFDIGLPVDGLIGLRVVGTEDTVSGTARETQFDSTTNSNVLVVTPITKRTNYTDFLPNVSARIHVTNNLQARLAFTMTRTRPDFDDLDPTLAISLPASGCTDGTDCVRNASSGNINLQPVRSKNYDISLEYYPARATSASIALFRHDVTGFISNVSEIVTDPDYGQLQLTRPENGGKGHIQGVEFAASTFLAVPWLPEWLQKFGVQGNVTYLDQSSELAAALSTTLPGQQPIAGVSNWLYNVAGFYETKGLSVRLTYNHRSGSVVRYDRLASDLVVPMTQNGIGWLSLSATATPTKNVSFTFSATNLLGAVSQNKRAFDAAGDAYIYQTRFLESVYRVGVRFRF